MLPRSKLLPKLLGLRISRRVLLEAAGSQLVEFAFMLPFLLVFLVGMIDFGLAYDLKHKLNNAAREGARFAAGENTLDLNCGASCTPAPASVEAVRDVVANYLTNAGVASCAVGTTSTYSSSNLTWTYSSSSTGCSNFSLIIERGYSYLNGSELVVASRVTLNYPYTWAFFNRVIGLLVSGSSYGSGITVTTNAVMENLP